MAGSISLLVSKELALLVQVAQGLDREVASQLRKHTRNVAEPVWKEELRGRVTTRVQTRALSDTARVSVSDTNVLMKSATIGKVGGVPASVLASGAEFGADPNKQISTRSGKGTAYKRRRGAQFLAPRRKGYVVFEAAGKSTARIASLWMQTTIRTVAETFEKGA